MDYKVWMYILLAVIFLLLLSLYYILRKPTHRHHHENAAINENDYIVIPSFKGNNHRDTFRMPVDDLACFVEFVDVDNEALNPKFFNGVLKNISVGGVKFVCEYEYPIEDEVIIKIRFSLRDNRFIVRGKLVRKELYPEKEKFGYGVQFTNILEEDRELLYQILNRMMFEKKRKMVPAGKLVGEESMV